MKLKIVLFLMMGAAVFAQQAPEAPLDDESGVNKPASLPQMRQTMLFTVSSLPEARVTYSLGWTIPFLRGAGSLTKDNNINPLLRADVTPVSFDITANIIWTPAAFLQIEAGARAGSGWKTSLFGKDLYGVGISSADDNGKRVITSEALSGSGIITKFWFGGALQADLAAFVPGEWNHVVMKAYHEINYNVFSAAKGGESWYYLNDDGENTNDAGFLGNYLIGYQMPFVINFAGCMAEVTHYLRNSPDNTWGDDIPRWVFSVLANVKINNALDFRALCQFETFRNYTDNNWKELYFRSRHLDSEDRVGFRFYRVVGMLLWRLQ